MKDEKEDSIDKLFSQGLKDPGNNASYREEDWDALESMLEGRKPKGIIYRLAYIISGIAALLLLVLGWLFLNPASKPDKTTPQVVKTKSQAKQDSGKYGTPVQQLADRKTQTPLAGTDSANNAPAKNRPGKSFFTLSADAGGRNTAGQIAKTDAAPKSPTVKTPSDTIIITDKAVNNMAVNNTKLDTIIITDKAAANLANNNAKADTIIAPKAPALVSVVDDIKPKKKSAKAGTSSGSFKPTLALSFIASPDINSVKGFSQNKVGTNAGLLLTLGVSKKWSISTGAVYSDKPYLTDFANYSSAYKFNTNPTSVSASCIVLDIPVNVGYQLYNSGGNKFSLGTGLSSYFMLRENYTFNYAGEYPGGPTSYNIRNKNKHIMGVLNLNATYQREISSKFGVGVQPYFKVPLTGIGYGQVNLKSAGVAVGVTWNINTGIKP
jgi:hypothetical protein